MTVTLVFLASLPWCRGTEVNRQRVGKLGNRGGASGWLVTAGTGWESPWKSVKAKSGRQYYTPFRGGMLSGDIGRAVSRLARVLRQLIGIINIARAVRDGTDSGPVKGREFWRLESLRRAECWVSERISVSTACDR